MRGRLSSALRRLAQFGACAALCLLVANCANKGNIDSRYGVSPSARLVSPGEPVPKGGGVYRVGSPYMVGGRVYVPHDDPNYNAVGLASWYGDDFYGRETANGEIFDVNSISAAHPTLPLPSYVRVTNLSNGHSLIVRVNDRGPYHGDRIIDVSMRAAHLLGFTNRGACLGARAICRTRADRGFRRPRAGVNASGQRTGAGAMGRAARGNATAADVPGSAAADPA